MATLTVTKYLLATALVSISFMANADPRDDQVRAAYASWNAAFNRADAKALAAFYTGNASFLPATHDIIQGPGG